MNMMTVPILPFNKSSERVLSETVSNNSKGGAFVPRGNILLGVWAIISIFKLNLKLKVIHQFFVIQFAIFKLSIIHLNNLSR